MKTELVQQISKEQYLKDAERLLVYKNLLWQCSMKIEVQKAFIISGDTVFKSRAEAEGIVKRYERLYRYIKNRLVYSSLQMIQSI